MAASSDFVSKRSEITVRPPIYADEIYACLPAGVPFDIATSVSPYMQYGCIPRGINFVKKLPTSVDNLICDEYKIYGSYEIHTYRPNVDGTDHRSLIYVNDVLAHTFYSWYVYTYLVDLNILIVNCEEVHTIILLIGSNRSTYNICPVANAEAITKLIGRKYRIKRRYGFSQYNIIAIYHADKFTFYSYTTDIVQFPQKLYISDSDDHSNLVTISSAPVEAETCWIKSPAGLYCMPGFVVNDLLQECREIRDGTTLYDALMHDDFLPVRFSDHAQLCEPQTILSIISMFDIKDVDNWITPLPFYGGYLLSTIGDTCKKLYVNVFGEKPKIIELGSFVDKLQYVGTHRGQIYIRDDVNLYTWKY